MSIREILDHLSEYALLIIAFFLWRLSAHLKAIRKHIAGKMLYDMTKDVIIEPKVRIRKKPKEEEIKNDTESS